MVTQLELPQRQVVSETRDDYGLDELGDKVAKRFGYTPLQTRQKEDQERHRIVNILKRLDVAPFDEKSVENYKEAKLEEGLAQGLNLEWRRFNVREYRRPVPEFVLQTMLDVDSALPGGWFGIEELTDTRHDPFLCLYYNQFRFYLHVWNEPSFDGKREC